MHATAPNCLEELKVDCIEVSKSVEEGTPDTDAVIVCTPEGELLTRESYRWCVARHAASAKALPMQLCAIFVTKEMINSTISMDKPSDTCFCVQVFPPSDNRPYTYRGSNAPLTIPKLVREVLDNLPERMDDLIQSHNIILYT